MSFSLLSCAARREDLNLAGATALFEARLAQSRARAAQGAANAAAITPPPRRQTLQIRLPPGVELDEFTEAARAAYDSEMVPTSPGAHSQRLAHLRRQIRSAAAKYNRAKAALDRLDAQYERARELAIQEFKIGHEDRLHSYVERLRATHDALLPDTIIGLAAKPSPDSQTVQNNGATQLALFGRNQLARADEYVDLKKSFLFIGNDIGTGIALGRVQALKGEINNKRLRANLDGLRLAAALKSLGRSLNLPLYLSPGVEAQDVSVRLDILDADGLDILDILIDNHALALAYDKAMGVARIYTRGEFAQRMESAVESARAHNQRAQHHKEIAQVEKDEANLRRVYQIYYQSTDAQARSKSLRNDALIEYGDSPIVGAAIVEFKKQALINERSLEAMREAHHMARHEPAQMAQALKFTLDDLSTIEMRLEDEMRLAAARTPPTPAPAASSSPERQAGMPERQAGVYVPRVQRARIIRDASLTSREPVYTERFIIFNSEGSNSCGGDADAGMSRAQQIGSNLDSYFDQLYPSSGAPRVNNRAAHETRNTDEEETRRDIRVRAGTRAVGGVLDNTIEGVMVSLPGSGAPNRDSSNRDSSDRSSSDRSSSNRGGASEDAPASTPQGGVSGGGLRGGSSYSPRRVRNASRPHITPVGNAVIVTGFKRDIEMASSIIEEIDRPAKQVLVEVFMVSVVKDWQRKFQSRIAKGVRTAAQADPEVLGLTDTTQVNIGETIAAITSNGLTGIGGALGFADSAVQNNNFLLRNFRLGLDWTIDFMERNQLARKISSPTLLALDGCEAELNKTQKRYIEVQQVSEPVVNATTAVAGASRTEFVERKAPLRLTVTPTINPLNDHVKLDIYFQDKIFTTEAENSPEVENIIDTEFIAAPGDVIVLAGLYSEDNSKMRDGLPGTTKLPFVTHLFGSNEDRVSGEEMLIFLAPTVITPKAGRLPVNTVSYYNSVPAVSAAPNAPSRGRAKPQ